MQRKKVDNSNDTLIGDSESRIEIVSYTQDENNFNSYAWSDQSMRKISGRSVFFKKDTFYARKNILFCKCFVYCRTLLE